MNRRTLLAAALLASLSACVADTGQSTVTLPISAEGTAPAPFVADGWTVTLAKAELAFGAAYFCATAAADARLCETANARGEPVISLPDSKIKLWVIPTDEERMIALHTASLLQDGAR